MKTTTHYGPSTTMRKDKRAPKWMKQRKDRGFDDTETWNLDATLAQFLVPRLKRFKEVAAGHPASMTAAEWDDILQQMIDGFQELIDDVGPVSSKKTLKAARLLGRHFFQLWW